MFIKIAMLLVFFGIMLYVGAICRKTATDIRGFVLGGHKVGPWLTAFAYGTTYFSAVIFVGYAGQFGWKFGIAATWIGIGNAIFGSLLAWIVLGRRTRLITRHLSSATMPDFFEKRYGNNSLRIGSSLIIFIFLIPYTASLYNGLSRLFSMAFNINYIVCIIAMALLTAVYVIMGGYMATAINDFIQGIIMLGGIVAIIIAVLRLNGGFLDSYRLLSQVQDASAGGLSGAFSSFLGPAPLDLLSVIVLTSLGTWGLPQLVHKFYAIRTEQDIRKGTIISTVFAIVIAGGCYFLGGFGRLFNVDIAADGFDAIVPTMLQRLPDILIGIAAILVLSASMSTLSGLVIASSSTLTLDFIKNKIAKKAGEKSLVLTMRVLIGVFIAISAIIAAVQFSSKVVFIAQLMGISWGALAGSFLAPFLYGLYWKRTTVAAVWTNFIFAAGLMTLNFLFRPSFPLWFQSPINCGAFVMVAGLVIVPLVSVFTKAPENSLVENAFSCYTTEKAVAVSESIGK